MTSQDTDILESQLNALLDALREQHGAASLERSINQAIEDLRLGRLDGEDALLARMRELVRQTRPAALHQGWLESWGNLFSQTVRFLLNSDGGAGKVIALLYGPCRRRRPIS